MRIRTLVFGMVLLALLLGTLAAPLWAQQTQKRSEVEFWPVAKAAELPVRPWGLYTLSFSVEIGGQLADIEGNHDVYESHLNYRDGFKVFAFDLQGKGNETAFFDNFYVRGAGWVSEPYSWVQFGFNKDRWFDFRGSFRESEYDWFFPGFARSQHFNDTKRRLQDYSLTLLPRRPVRIKLGYKRNSSFGPSFSTIDFSRGEFPGFEPIRQTYDEYTLGAEWSVHRWLIAGEFGDRYFRNDRFITLFDTPRPYLPNDPADRASFNSFERLHPSRGEIPFYRLNLVGRPHDTLEVNARLVYSRGKTDFTRTDSIDGTTYQQGASLSTTIIEENEAFGEAILPLTTFDGNVTWRPIPRLTITNNFQYRGYDIAGFSDETRDITCGDPTRAGCPLDTTTSNSAVQNLFWSSFHDQDSFQDRIEASYDVTDWLTLRGGFLYLDRTWRHTMFESESEDGVLLGEDEELESIEAINRAWLAGAVFRPNKRVHIFFDMENGNFTRVFNRQGPADLDRYRLRGRFEPWQGIRFNASWFIFDNSNFQAPIPNPAFLNSATLPEELPGRHSSRNRGITVDFQLARFERGYLNAGYARNDITAITDVTIPARSPAPYVAGIFTYILDDNYWYVDGGGRVAGKFFVDAGYRLVDSSGSFPPSDPVNACEPFEVQQCDNTNPVAFQIFTGGVSYHQPHAAVRYSFSDRVNWKFGWRYYKYNQEGGTFSDYKAHVLTTSVILSF